MTIIEEFQAVRLGWGSCDGRGILVKMSTSKTIINIQTVHFC